MSPLSITLGISDNFAVIHPNSTSWRHVLGGCTFMPGNFGEFRTGALGESGTRGLKGISTGGLEFIRYTRLERISISCSLFYWSL